MNSKNLSGKPDIVLKKYNTVIFVHGCFWHGHSCKYAKIPATNTEFWEQKILSNKKRDENVIKQLEQQGWKVIVIWQCQLKKAQRDITISSLIKEIQENGK